MFKFKTWREDHKRVRSETGSPVKPVYSAKFDENGVLCLEQVGEENIYESIQSYAESVDLNNILARFENGEVDVLNRVQGFYFDTTEVPDSMSELLNKLYKAQDEFQKLPASFKEQYGNNFERFICTFHPSAFATLINNPEKVVEKAEQLVHDAKVGDFNES